VKTLRFYRTFVAWPLMAVMLSLSLPMGYARAAIVTTEQVIAQADAAAERARVRAFLSRDDVRRQMVEMGVNADEASARVGSLTDAEVLQIASRIDEAPAGQAGGSIVVVLLVVVLIILLWPFN